MPEPVLRPALKMLRSGVQRRTMRTRHRSVPIQYGVTRYGTRCGTPYRWPEKRCRRISAVPGRPGPALEALRRKVVPRKVTELWRMPIS